MESYSEAGRINISEDTYQLVQDRFNCEYRGKIDAKNRGHLGMHFVKEIKHEKDLHEYERIASEFQLS